MLEKKIVDYKNSQMTNLEVFVRLKMPAESIYENFLYAIA